jgi:glycosyltransferase involved in cell wall biosynthesis
MRLTALLSIYRADRLPLVQTTFKSLFAQTRPFDEVVVVVEGEINRELQEYLEHLSQTNPILNVIKVPNQVGPLGFGLPACMNIGLEAATGDWVFKVDSDDLNHERRVEYTLEVLKRFPLARLIGGQAIEMNQDMTLALNWRKVPVKHEVISRRFAWRNPFNGPTVAVHRATALEVGGFPIVGANEDYALWGRIWANGHLCVNSPKVLVYMRGGLGLVQRRSNRRYRLGEKQALSSLYVDGVFSAPRYLWHLVVKGLVRRMPLWANTYLYQRILRRPSEEVPLSQEDWNYVRSIEPRIAG